MNDKIPARLFQPMDEVISSSDAISAPFELTQEPT